MALKKFADASAACIGPERQTDQYRVFCRWWQWMPQARRRTGDGRINGASRSRAIVLVLAAQPSVDQAPTGDRNARRLARSIPADRLE
jgi:hypothetical protein